MTSLPLMREDPFAVQVESPEDIWKGQSRERKQQIGVRRRFLSEIYNKIRIVKDLRVKVMM